MRLQRMELKGLTPAPRGLFRTGGKVSSSEKVTSNSAPQPFDDLRDHVAEQQERRRPHQRRGEIGELKTPIWHLEYPGSERHRGPQRSEKPPDENARYAPVFHKGFSKRQDPRLTRRRPH